jgi:hypothetical protein
VVKRDFAAAYAFETPEYREKHTAEEFASQFGRQVRWDVAKVKDLSYDRADVVDVTIALNYSFALPGVDQLVQTEGEIDDRWVFVDDQWWRQHVARPLGATTQSQPSQER